MKAALFVLFAAVSLCLDGYQADIPSFVNPKWMEE